MPTPRAPRKPTLSPTKIRTYLDCGVKYKYVYLDKLGRFYQKSKSYYSFGSSLHHVLQEFHEEGATHAPEQMVVSLQQQWISAGYQSQDEEQTHKEAGERIVQEYHASFQERIAAQIQTLFVEKTITCDLGPFKLSGRVDRIDRHANGTLEIIDYKSGRMETTTEEVAGDLAMNCYQLILQHLYPDIPIIATIYSLRSGSSASASLQEGDSAGFLRDILALGEEILGRDYTEITPKRIEICPYCDFLPLCERFWKRQSAEDILDPPFSDEL
jgi:RecB family exonuclease